MFYYAQKAVLHPTSPLYMMEEQEVSAFSSATVIHSLVRNLRVNKSNVVYR